MALPLPVGKQGEVVYLPAKGHFVVLGTAGSGKTTMAVARAKVLADPQLPGGGPTLLVTFNKALTRYISIAAEQLPAQVHVRNYHHFARGYLAAKGRMGGKSILPSGLKPTLVEQALEQVRAAHEPHAFFERKLSFFLDEIKWISSHNIQTLPQYEATTRVGRASANLSSKLKPAMWEVFSQYRSLRQARGYLYDLEDIACAVSSQLEDDTTPRMYQHVIIDEGQDFTPEMIRSLVKAVPPDGSVTFFGDVAQQIYGRRVSWRDAGLNSPVPWEFKQNYRNTLSIAKLGLAISRMPYYQGEPDMVPPIFPTADGPKPTLVKLGSEAAELALIKQLALVQGAQRSVAVLLRTHAHIAKVKNSLPRGARALNDGNADWDKSAGTYYGTYHSAKGLEFDLVILPFLSEDELSSQSDIEEFGIDEANAQDGRLLYVGVTRAKSDLILTYTGTVTKLLPDDNSLYTKVAR